MAKRRITKSNSNTPVIEIDERLNIPTTLSVLPLRDIVVFPWMIYPALIGRASSLKAVAEAVERDKYIFLTTQTSSEIEEPTKKDIFKNGVVAKIVQVLRLPNNLLKVLVEGLYQAKITSFSNDKDYFEGRVTLFEHNFDPEDLQLKATMRHASELFAEYIKENEHTPEDILTAFENIEDPVKKLFYAAANIQSTPQIKQRILDQKNIQSQYFVLCSILSSELEMLRIEDEIDSKVHDTIQKTQKKYYIQEQIRALQKELGEDENLATDLISLKQDLDNANIPDTVKAKIEEEFDKLKKTPQMSPEYSVNRNYLELVSKLPWSKKSIDNLDVTRASAILDEDHYDLKKPKERILEFISILNLAGTLKRQIICFVGPPGVGKTSLAKSIARALGREFVRFSLGGVRDEAEIRGHRRTYIGAMPGKIIQSMKKAETINPVILLDEIDKMATDFRGDPSSALLEVLDPEQNSTFQDHYLEVDYDLSNVLFVTTANVQYEIPGPLLDRMEVIEVGSYLDFEKLEIAKRHIIPKIIEEFGMSEFNFDIKDEAIMKIIREYTREAGVRNLERAISSLFRKLAKEIVVEFESRRKVKAGDDNIAKKALKSNPYFKKVIKTKEYVIDEELVERLLKAPKYKNRKEDLADKVGVATGLAWTSVGGDTLPVEVNIMPGKDNLTLTGKLGDVMKESARAALTYVKANYEKLGIDPDFFKEKDIHIHVPEGAIPKDGPSAGITLSMALISAATNKSIRGDLAMTGEVTLRGNVLAIGGLNEKLLAAKRIGIKTVLIPKENERDIEEVNQVIINELQIVPVSNIDEALPYVFRDSLS